MSDTNCERCGGSGTCEGTVKQRLGDWSFYEDVEWDCPECEGTGIKPEMLLRVRAAEWAWELYTAIAGPRADWDLCPALVRG